MVNSTNIRIPKKYERMVSELYHDSDGYWLTLAEGFRSPATDSHIIHEDTQKQVLAELALVEKE